MGWIVDLVVAGGATGTIDEVVSLLAEGQCAEAREITQDPEFHVPELYDGAAAACLAAFSGRTELWKYAEEVAARAIQLNDCYERAIADLLRSLVDIHRQEPTAQLRRKPAENGETFPCPRILQLEPEHGPSEGGYPLRVIGVHLPPVVVIHFLQYVDSEAQDTLITVNSVGGTEAVVTVPQRHPGADSTVPVYPEGWALAPTNTPVFTFEDQPASELTSPATPDLDESPTSSAATETPTPAPSQAP